MKNISKSIMLSCLPFIGFWPAVGMAQEAGRAEVSPAAVIVVPEPVAEQVNDTIRMTWVVDQAGAERSFTFNGREEGRFRVEWGDGQTEELTGNGERTEVKATHVYAEPAAYAVKIYGLPYGNYTETYNGIDMEMVYVAGGAFTMGCTADNSNDCRSEENPHRVILDGYYIGKCEVTQKQWQAVMGTTLDDLIKEYRNQNTWVKTTYSGLYRGDDYPICFVSWEEANAFCDTLSKRTGLPYALPTEAQWEYAARGGVHRHNYVYSGSDNPVEVAWFADESEKYTETLADGSQNTYRQNSKVGQKQANELGLHDMSGNVMEWCRDWYNNKGCYTEENAVNPVWPTNSTADKRSQRGGATGHGSFKVWGRTCNFYMKGRAGMETGFRVARMLKAE